MVNYINKSLCTPIGSVKSPMLADILMEDLEKTVFERFLNRMIPTAYYSFKMIQTPFQIMSGWPIRFRNNKLGSLTDFISQSNRFQKGYQINDADISENLDAFLQEEAGEWFYVAKKVGLIQMNLKEIC